MTKTALEMSRDSWRAYRPFWKAEPDIERWKRAWETARKAADALRERFGATRVVVFGSLTQREWFTQWSDVDIAAWGIPPGDFYRAVAFVTGFSAEFGVDLVDPDTCRPSLKMRIEHEGIEV